MSLPIELRHAVLLAEVFLAVALITWLLSSRGGTPMRVGTLMKALGFGAIIALVAAYVTLEYRFDIPLLDQTHPELVDRYRGFMVATNTLWASAVEELAKYVVGVFTLLSFHQTKPRLSDTIIAMIVVGLGFSLIEDVLYLVSPDANAPFRLLSFYLHSGTSAIIGYSLGRFRFGLCGYRELGRAVLSAILLHAAFNLATQLQAPQLGFYLTFAITLFITLQIFILFRRTIAEENQLNQRTRPKAVPTKLLNLEKTA